MLLLYHVTIEIASVVILLYSRPVVCTGLQGGRGEMALRGHNRGPGVCVCVVVLVWGGGGGGG